MKTIDIEPSGDCKEVAILDRLKTIQEHLYADGNKGKI